MNELKTVLSKWFRPLLVKWITRGTLWLLTGFLGFTAAEAEEPTTQIVAGVATVIIGGVAYAIDRLHHRLDRAEPPEQ